MSSAPSFILRINYGEPAFGISSNSPKIYNVRQLNPTLNILGSKFTPILPIKLRNCYLPTSDVRLSSKTSTAVKSKNFIFSN